MKLLCVWVVALGVGVGYLALESHPDSSLAQGRSRSQAGRGGAAKLEVGHRRRGTPVRWQLLSIPGSRRVRIGGSVPWCPGSDAANLPPIPRIQRVRRIERPHKVFITAFLIHRARKGCLAVASPVHYVVTLRHKLNGRSLYDASTSPPAKRWPRSGQASG